MAGLTGMVASPHRHSGGAGVPALTRAEQSVPLPRSAAKLLGQRIMVGMSGTRPSGALLRSLRRGEVGAVILFASNVTSRRQSDGLTNQLQRAARSGGNPGLLIATDQEGGEVKRLPNGPPSLSPPQMAATHSVATAASQGRDTGSYMKRWGINMNLAPVADVPTFGGAFIWRQGRAFSFSARTVADYATAFAGGLQARGVAATAKHFPGLGSAAVTTDQEREELHPTLAQRRAALTPYTKLIGAGVDAVMVAVAGYPAYDHTGAAAALSKPIIRGVLRGRLHFRGVAITDALGSTSGHDERTAGVLAAAAGSDVLLFTDSAPGELGALETALRHGTFTRADADNSYRRIVALKRALGVG